MPGRPLEAKCPYRTVPCKNSAIITVKDKSGICSAEAETVRHDTVKLGVVDATSHNGHVLERGIQLLDIRALANEAVVHHEQREDALLYPDGAQRMSRKGLRRGNLRHGLAREHLADGLDLLLIADRRRG